MKKYQIVDESRKKKLRTKTILTLRKGKEIISKQDEILHEVVSFYEELYTGKKVTRREVQRYNGSSAVNKINEEEKIICEGLLSSAECRKAAFKMPNNKAPRGRRFADKILPRVLG